MDRPSSGVLARPSLIRVAALCGFVCYVLLLPGNGSTYSFDRIERLEDSPLEGKNICVLGSSVVDGPVALWHSVPEYISARFGCTYTKEAVVGTSLAGDGDSTYVQRLLRLDTGVHYDLFICQLSTNDATLGLPLGEVAAGTSLEDFDIMTTTGALEYHRRAALALHVRQDSSRHGGVS